MDDHTRHPLTFVCPNRPAIDQVLPPMPPEAAKYIIDAMCRAFPNDYFTVIYGKTRTVVEPIANSKLDAELGDLIGRLMGMEKTEANAKTLGIASDLLADLNGK